jgi:molecular chaperone HscC
MSKIIGIDLGTTNSAAASMTDEGPRLIPNALGESLTPSIVGVDEGGQLLVGRAARELQVLQPERCAALFKRYMGSDWTAEIAGRKFTPEELSSLVLRSLKTDAEAFFGEPVSRAVITVPAYFNDRQRKATLNAGRIAGLQVERIFNEPTAAALAYGFHESRDDQVLLIFDLGGGTFDVSVVELFEGVLEVRASSGESFLGGEDFTRTLAARILEMQGQPFERTELDAPRLVSRLIQQCELVGHQSSIDG